jgi:hypothetical protein
MNDLNTFLFLNKNMETALGVSRSIPEKVNPTAELVELFANAIIEHERCVHVEWEKMDTGCVSHKYISHVTIGNAKIVVDGDLSVG